MLGEIWDTITEGIGTAWDALMELPELFSGFFTDVNKFGWLILTIIAEVFLWVFWYWCIYVKDIDYFLDMKTMFIATLLAPVIAYILAWRASR